MPDRAECTAGLGALWSVYRRTQVRPSLREEKNCEEVAETEVAGN